MRPVIIFGAGIMGRKLLNILQWNVVTYFADNDKGKHGKKIRNIPVISFDKMISLATEYDIILSTPIIEMEKQLLSKGIQYWTWWGENSFFSRKSVIETQDKYLLDKFLYDKGDRDHILSYEIDNWFRKEYYLDENEEIINKIKCNKLQEIYNYDMFYDDERYINRPGMRLIHNILKAENNGKLKICDLACGHGELLKQLKSDGFETYGVDCNPIRVNDLKDSLNIEIYCGRIESTIFEKNFFDVIIILECLEHVKNVYDVIEEIRRILIKGGMVFCTVPWGKYCDDKEHVRHFTEESLFSIFSNSGFDIINIQRIPYLNHESNNSILVQACKNID